MKTHTDGDHSSDDDYRFEVEGSDDDYSISDYRYRKSAPRKITGRRKAVERKPAPRKGKVDERMSAGTANGKRKVRGDDDDVVEVEGMPAAAAGKKNSPKSLAREKQQRGLQKSSVASKMVINREENVQWAQLLGEMADDPDFHAVNWTSIPTEDGVEHDCVVVSCADLILKRMVTRKGRENEYYVGRGGYSKESRFRSMFITSLRFECVSETEAKPMEMRPTGPDWVMVMNHPKFHRGADGKVDKAALLDIVQDNKVINPVRERLNWDVDPGMKKDKRKKRKYEYSYVIPRSKPQKIITVVLGSFPVEEGQERSQEGELRLKKAKELVIGRKAKGESVAKDVVQKILEECLVKLSND